MQRKTTLIAIFILGVLLTRCSSSPPQQAVDPRPNILFAIADDQSWPHAGAYGDKVVQTPVFDRVASEGALFSHAFASSPSCTPSRAAILTGQDVWRLQEGGNLVGTLPAKFAVYPDLLEAAGYVVGFSEKGWSPGDFEAGGRQRNPAGPRFESFAEFFESVPQGQPFCFWFGSIDPHRPYTAGSGLESGKKLEDVVVPAFLPDTPEVRGDILDYYVEIERFDRHVGEMLRLIEQAGLGHNTIVVITSDNGMPFPRGKTNLYDAGTRMPLAARWPAKVPAGRVVEDFVTLTDWAPTFLEAAGIPIPAEFTGRSLLPILLSKQSGQIESQRDRAFLGRERHGWNREPNVGYPMRALRTLDHLYIRNFAPDRFPGFDTDPSPTLDYLMEHRQDAAVRPFFQLWTAPRPEEELYDLRKDPDQLRNVAGDPAYAETKSQLRASLESKLKETGDPRMLGNGDIFDSYEYYGPSTGNYEKLKAIRTPGP